MAKPEESWKYGPFSKFTSHCHWFSWLNYEILCIYSWCEEESPFRQQWSTWLPRSIIIGSLIRNDDDLVFRIFNVIMKIQFAVSLTRVQRSRKRPPSQPKKRQITATKVAQVLDVDPTDLEFLGTNRATNVSPYMAFKPVMITLGHIFWRKQHDAFYMVVMSDFDGETLTFKVIFSYTAISITCWFVLNCSGWQVIERQHGIAEWNTVCMWWPSYCMGWKIQMSFGVWLFCVIDFVPVPLTLMADAHGTLCPCDNFHPTF